jgi:hypothetical protein
MWWARASPAKSTVTSGKNGEFWKKERMAALCPHTPQHIKSVWSHYTDTSEPVEVMGLKLWSLSNPGFEPATFRSLVQHANHSANRAREFWKVGGWALAQSWVLIKQSKALRWHSEGDWMEPQQWQWVHLSFWLAADRVVHCKVVAVREWPFVADCVPCYPVTTLFS